MIDESQAVVEESDEKPEASTEGTDARTAEPEKSLDELLAEFGMETKSVEKAKPSTPEQKTDDAAVSDEDREFLADLRRRETDKQFRDEITPVIKSIRSEVSSFDILSDDEMIYILDGMARSNPRLASAWTNRHDNPAGWQKVVYGIAKEFKSRVKNQPDKAATEDREAVAAAVRGASTKAPEDSPPDYSRMSNAEYRQEIYKRHGYYPAV